MPVFSPTNAKVHFKAYDGSFTDALGNTTITQNNDVTISNAQKIYGSGSMYMEDFEDGIYFDNASLFDVGYGDYTVGFWYHPTQITTSDRIFVTDTHESTHEIKPLRIYNGNGWLGVYVESDSESPATDTHDLLMQWNYTNRS